MSKKLNKLFAYVLVVLLLLTFPLSIVLQNANKPFIQAQQNALEDNDEIFNQENQGLVYVTGANLDKDGINQPIYETQSSTYVIKVNLWLSSAFNGESFNVYYRTYDISAIASTGDYEHKEGKGDHKGHKHTGKEIPKGIRFVARHKKEPAKPKEIATEINEDKFLHEWDHAVNGEGKGALFRMLGNKGG